MNYDPLKTFITLEDGTVWQVLDADGNYDDAATAAAIKAHLDSAGNGTSQLH